MRFARAIFADNDVEVPAERESRIGKSRKILEMK